MTFNPSTACLYRFVSLMNNNMVLDMSQNHKQLNKAIVFEWHASSNQRFAIRQVSGGKFAIFCAKNNMVLVPECNSNGNGARLTFAAPQKSQAELWILQPVKHSKLGNRRGFIIKSHCGKAIDICEAKCKNQQPVIQWQVNGNENQIWIIQEY